jgi:hypothetical protein
LEGSTMISPSWMPSGVLQCRRLIPWDVEILLSAVQLRHLHSNGTAPAACAWVHYQSVLLKKARRQSKRGYFSLSLHPFVSQFQPVYFRFPAECVFIHLLAASWVPEYPALFDFLGVKEPAWSLKCCGCPMHGGVLSGTHAANDHPNYNYSKMAPPMVYGFTGIARQGVELIRSKAISGHFFFGYGPQPVNPG